MKDKSLGLMDWTAMPLGRNLFPIAPKFLLHDLCRIAFSVIDGSLVIFDLQAKQRTCRIHQEVGLQKDMRCIWVRNYRVGNSAHDEGRCEELFCILLTTNTEPV